MTDLVDSFDRRIDHLRMSLRNALQSGCSDAKIRREFLAAIARKPEQHNFQCDADQAAFGQMVTLGG